MKKQNLGKEVWNRTRDFGKEWISTGTGKDAPQNPVHSFNKEIEGVSYHVSGSRPEMVTLVLHATKDDKMFSVVENLVKGDRNYRIRDLESGKDYHPESSQELKKAGKAYESHLQTIIEKAFPNSGFEQGLF